jgi:hypothetical protein
MTKVSAFFPSIGFILKNVSPTNIGVVTNSTQQKHFLALIPNTSTQSKVYKAIYQ